MSDKLLTIGEVADILHVSDATVRKLIKAGELPAVKVGSRYRVSPKDLDQYIEGGRNGHG